LAGTAIKRLQLERLDELPPAAAEGELERPASVLAGRAVDVTSWYRTLGAAFARPDRPLPADGHTDSAESFLEVVLPVVETCDDALRAQAERLLWSGQYLGDVDRLRPERLEPARHVAAARARPWWGV